MCVAVYVMSISKVMQSTFGGTKIFFSDNNRIGRLRVTRKIILENILFNTKLAGVLCDKHPTTDTSLICMNNIF